MDVVNMDRWYEPNAIPLALSFLTAESFPVSRPFAKRYANHLSCLTARFMPSVPPPMK